MIQLSLVQRNKACDGVVLFQAAYKLAGLANGVGLLCARSLYHSRIKALVVSGSC